jgi:chemotaxis protein CheZ
MSELQTLPPSPLRESDYEAIEAAVMETEKGRWFLAEYARRHRNADTEIVLSAIGGLERMMKRERRPDVDRIRLDIGEMKDAIERTKAEIAQIKHDAAQGSHFDKASSELDAIVSQTEQATSDILAAAEKIQEIAWTMREAGIEEEICQAVEDLTTTIYMACSFQDLTGQRTQKVVHVLRYLEHRIDSMIDIWGMEESEVRKTSAEAGGAGPVLDTRPDAHLLNGPALAGHGMDQGDVDHLLFDAPGQTPEDSIVSPDTLDWASPDDDLQAESLTADFEPLPVTPAEDWDETAAEATAHEPGPDAEDESEVMARAAEAMEEAIETLKGVSGSVGLRPLPPGLDDPFEQMTKVERQALFS